MANEIRKELIEAKKLYQSKNYEGALEIYEKRYNENPDDLGEWDRRFYSWAIYQTSVKEFTDEEELVASVEKITELIPQADLNESPTCAYTLSVFKVLDCLYKENDFYDLTFWLDKLNPELLDDNKFEYNDRTYPSKREKYYNYASKAYLEQQEYEQCIEISKRALDDLSEFANSSDVWYNWRIAKSLKELSRNEEAIEYLKEVSKAKRDWFVKKELAENYHIIGDNQTASTYAGEAALTKDPALIKVNLYHLIYNILKDDEPEMAMKHAELFVALKSESSSRIPDEIEDLMINEDELDKNALEREIKQYWSQAKYKGQELQYGTIVKIFDHGGAGFIMSNDDERHFFNMFEFKGDKSLVREGMYVSFYTEKSFDKSKNQESIIAVNIHEE